MERPASRTQLDKLGKRMASCGYTPDDDRVLFRRFLEYYQAVLDSACIELRQASIYPTSRVKTTGTLIQKLQRERGLQLSRINDFAGARVVLTEGGIVEQDKYVELIAGLFGEHPREPEVIDRRSDPRQGYRAVHVVVFPDGTPVEIQVRTALQDYWAQIYEKFADQWGRELRYDGLVSIDEDEANPVRANLGPLIELMVEFLMHLSKGILLAENSRRNLAVVEPTLEMLNSAENMLTEATFEAMDEDEYRQLRKAIQVILQRHVPDRRRRGRIVRRNLQRAQPDPAKVLRATLISRNLIASAASIERAGAELVEKTTRDALKMLQFVTVKLAEAERAARDEQISRSIR